jgi:hypothetical protein
MAERPTRDSLTLRTPSTVSRPKLPGPGAAASGPTGVQVLERLAVLALPKGTYPKAFVRRMAQASDVAYYIDVPGGVRSCPVYGQVGFQGALTTAVRKKINAVLIGRTATEIIVAFRGSLAITTETFRGLVTSVRDWINNAEVGLLPADYTAGKVHRGFSQALATLWPTVLEAALTLHAATDLPIVFTGHSKGGALARLGALRLLAEAGLTSKVSTYAAPRAGDIAFAQDSAASIAEDWRFENADDLVPRLPPTSAPLDVMSGLLVTDSLPQLLTLSYQHAGLLEFLNWYGTVTEGDSLILEGLRAARMAELIATGDFDQIAASHSLEKAYLPKLA